MARTTVAAQLAKIRKEQAALAKREKTLLANNHGKALAKISVIARENGLSVEAIVDALKAGKPGKAAKVPAAGKKRGASKLAGKPVAPKYRNPANPSETWAGRGRAPAWAQALKDAGTLESAAITAAPQTA